jgi:hypothetical protein
MREHPVSPDAARSALLQRIRDDEDISTMYPDFRLRIWAERDGVHLRAMVYMPGERFQRRVEVLKQAVWQPDEVTVGKVLEWGRRALLACLEERIGSSEG